MARPTVTGIDPVEFAEGQGELLMQILLWMTAAMEPDERRPFIKGAAGVVIGHVAAARRRATQPAARRKAGRK